MWTRASKINGLLSTTKWIPYFGLIYFGYQLSLPVSFLKVQFVKQSIIESHSSFGPATKASVFNELGTEKFDLLSKKNLIFLIQAS